jgi:hypothetical protein
MVFLVQVQSSPTRDLVEATIKQLLDEALQVGITDHVA